MPRLLALLPLLLIVGCVSQGRYDAALEDAQAARRELSAARNDFAQRLSDREKVLQELLAQAEERCATGEQALAGEKARSEGCRKSLDAAVALNAGLRAELEKLGKNVDQLMATKSTLSASLEEARQRLEELRRAQAAADARAQLFRELALKLKRMVDAGELEIRLRGGRMVLVLPNDVLFDSGKTQVKPRGKEALGRVAAVLKTLPDRHFQVAGHTDNEPIKVSGFASNWELSAERALRVVELMIEAGMAADTLSAAGYGEFDPVAPNDTKEGMAKNRRIEITLQPNIDELVAVPEHS